VGWVLRCSAFEQQQHAVILGVLWELVVNSNADIKISAAVLSKALKPYIRLVGTILEVWDFLKP
jgi:hypothetical protein